MATIDSVVIRHLLLHPDHWYEFCCDNMCCVFFVAVFVFSCGQQRPICFSIYLYFLCSYQILSDDVCFTTNERVLLMASCFLCFRSSTGDWNRSNVSIRFLHQTYSTHRRHWSRYVAREWSSFLNPAFAAFSLSRSSLYVHNIISQQLLLSSDCKLLDEILALSTVDFAEDLARWLLSIFEQAANPMQLLQWAIRTHVRNTGTNVWIRQKIWK
jgi:hypothetical protein